MAAVSVVLIVMTETRLPIVGFEKEFLDLLRETVSALPEGTAEFFVGQNPSRARQSFAYFRIKPTNPHSAGIEGYVYEGQGIDFTIGVATSGEVFVSSGKGARLNSRVDWFLRVCRAIFTTHSTETVTYDANGRPIRGRLVLSLDGRRIRLGASLVLWPIRLGKTTKQFSYEPYL